MVFRVFPMAGTTLCGSAVPSSCLRDCERPPRECGDKRPVADGPLLSPGCLRPLRLYAPQRFLPCFAPRNSVHVARRFWHRGGHSVTRSSSPPSALVPTSVFIASIVEAAASDWSICPALQLGAPHQIRQYADTDCTGAFHFLGGSGGHLRPPPPRAGLTRGGGSHGPRSARHYRHLGQGLNCCMMFLMHQTGGGCIFGMDTRTLAQVFCWQWHLRLRAEEIRQSVLVSPAWCQHTNRTLMDLIELDISKTKNDLY